MHTYQVDAQRGDRWWVLTVPEIPGAVSQARTYFDVNPTARDLISTMLDVPAHSFALHVQTAEEPDWDAETEAYWADQPEMLKYDKFIWKPGDVTVVLPSPDDPPYVPILTEQQMIDAEAEFEAELQRQHDQGQGRRK